MLADFRIRLILARTQFPSGIRRKSSWTGILLTLLSGILAPSPASGADALPQVGTIPPSIFSENRRPQPTGFWSHYATQLEEKGSEIELSGRPAALDLVRALNRDSYGFHKHLASLGANLFGGIMLDSLRETCVERISLVKYLEEGDSPAARFASRLFAGSLGNTLEERALSGFKSPSGAALERSWLRRARENGVLDYGIRPWRLNPYAYCTFSFGHFGDRPVLVDTRFCTVLDSWRLGVMQIQEQAVIPLFGSCHFVLGVSLCPTAMNSRGKGPSASVRLERLRKHAGSALLWFLGAQTGPRGSKCFAGFAMPAW